MNEAHAHRRPMQATDADRIVRLSEEIRGRLQEIGMIVNRTAGSSDGRVVRFVAREATMKQESTEGDWMEIIEVDGVEACYGVIDGQAFAESPCGAGG